MSDERHSDFERELTAGLDRAAPTPRPDAALRLMDRVAATPQRAAWRAALASAAPRGAWSRALAYGVVGLTALVMGVAIGTSGLLPTGDPSSPTPGASSPVTAPTVPSPRPSPVAVPEGWTEVVVDAGLEGSDVTIEGGLTWRGGAVLTGSLYPAAAEGRFPIAWYSTDGRIWSRARFDPNGSSVFPRTIGAAVDAGDRLVAFGTGQDAGGQDLTVLYESADGGATWIMPPQQLPGDALIADVVRFGRQLVAVGATMAGPTAPVLWTSDDGRSWQLQPLAGPNGPLLGRYAAIATDGRQLVVLGSVTDRAGASPLPLVMTSLDVRDWLLGDLPAGEDAELRDLVFFAQAWHAVGSDAGGPASWWSSDGYGWRPIPIDGGGTTGGLSALGIGSEGLVAVGGGGDAAAVWRSISGQRWDPAEVLAMGGSARVVLSTPSGILVAGTSAASGTSQPMAWLRASAATVAWHEPAAYSFVVDDQHCGAGERDYLGLMRVYVEDGMTLEYVALDATAQGFSGVPEDIPTLADLLARVAEAQGITEPIQPPRPGESGVGSLPIVRLTTDPEDGHPVRIYIDWLPDGVDDEECYVISEYVAEG